VPFSCSIDDMTIDQDLVARRWAAADADAERVLADEQWFLEVSRSTRLSTGIGLLVIVVALVGFLVLPRGDDDMAHGVLGMILSAAALAAAVAHGVAAQRRRRVRGQAYPTVTTVLGARERHAIARAADGRVTAPEDRLRIVRAAAVNRADAGRIAGAVWLTALYSSTVLTVGSTAAGMLVLYGVVATIGAAQTGWTVFDVVRVRRYLRRTATPRTGA
jgi:hypothetical protein